MEKAIKKAIEGGWLAKHTVNGFKMNKKNWQACITLEGSYNIVHLLDPLFWKALGKTEGWKGGQDCYECGGSGTCPDAPEMCAFCYGTGADKESNYWVNSMG